MPRILVVCTANICRSPVVEAILQARFREHGWDDWRVSSAGTLALPGFGPAEYSLEVLGERGLDIRDHRSQRAEQRHLEAADLVLCMEWGHKEALQVEFPQYRERIRLLSEMVGDHHEVDDPIGGPRVGYERMIDEVTELVDKGLKTIVELAWKTSRQRLDGATATASSAAPASSAE